MESTEVYKPVIYLISNKRTIKVEGTLSVGRTQGDLIISDPKLSSLHCQIFARGINFYIQDNNSTNGVFINGKKIESDKEVQFHSGDTILMGSESYVVSFEKKLAPSTQNSDEEIKIFSKDMFYLYGISLNWKLTYGVMILVTLLLFIVGDHADVPQHLIFLQKEITQITFMAGITVLIWGLLIYLTHAYCAKMYLKNTAFFRWFFFVFACFVHFLGAFIITVAVLDSSSENNYITSRSFIVKYGFKNEKEVQRYKNDMKNYVEIISEKLNESERRALKRDYEMLGEIGLKKLQQNSKK